MDFDRIKKVSNDTRSLLEENEQEWKERYSSYATRIEQTTERIISNGRRFNQWIPLYIYMNLLNAMANKHMFSLRFKGQEVGKINVHNGMATLSTMDALESNENYFNFNKALDNVTWDGPEATEFRNYFKKNWGYEHETHSLESELESLFLTELERNDGDDKFLGTFWGMQPVKIAGRCRFQMRTPLQAAGPKLQYRGAKGGGIDILSRFGRGNGTISVCELKTPMITDTQSTLEQCLEYAIFIRELLRSDSGGTWHRIFGYKRPVPKKLTLNCVVIMGSDSKKFANMPPLEIDDDRIFFHYMHYEVIEKNVPGSRNRIVITETSLPQPQRINHTT